MIFTINKSAFANHLTSRVYVLDSAPSHPPTQGVSCRVVPNIWQSNVELPWSWYGLRPHLGSGLTICSFSDAPLFPPWYTVEGGGTPYGDCLVSWSLNILMFMFDLLLLLSRVNARTPPSASSSLPLYVCLIAKEEHLLLSVGPPGTQMRTLITASSQETSVGIPLWPTHFLSPFSSLV